MASGVIYIHSWPLPGHQGPDLGSLDDAFVDGFFVMSGYLITSSWLRNPRLREYLVSRFLRIFPGLWVCLLVVAFVIAPIAVAIQGGPVREIFLSTAPIEWVLNNAVLNVYYAGIAGTPSDVPWPGVWDGSLWTLIFEIFCYIGVAIAGVLGLLRFRWTVLAAFILAVIWSAIVSYPVDALQTIPQMVARFAVVFLAGMVIHQFQDVIPARWSLVALSLGIVIASGLLMVNYRVVAAIPLAYALIVSAALLKNERLRLRTDLSYGVYIYAWPIQQLLVICGLTVLSGYLFAVVALMVTLPLAAFSWFVVEKPAMALKTRILRKKHDLPPVTVQQQAATG